MTTACPTAFETPTALALNLTHRTRSIAKLLKEDFRIALSHVMIAEIVLNDLCPAARPSRCSTVCRYRQRLAKRYAIDTAKANEMLRRYVEEQAASPRLDGQPLAITIEVAQAFRPWAQQMEMVARNWKSGGH